jgi:ATP-dependent Lon protease
VFEETDVHLHVPEGATPKDGPSAGITICTAMLSAFMGKKSKRSYAMTGEITLRGNVLAIGGLKEKALAAYRLGIKDIIIPKANLKDLEEIPSEILSKITFHPVSKIDEVINLCIEK